MTVEPSHPQHHNLFWPHDVDELAQLPNARCFDSLANFAVNIDPSM